MLSHKRLAVVVTSAFAALALAACTTLSASATAQPTPGPSESGAASEQFGTGCTSMPTDPNDPASFQAMAKQKVAAAAEANPKLTTLAAALREANLTDTLNNAENITVFAPTDDAFAKIAVADLEAMLSDQATLKQILTYHVVPQTLTPDNLAGTHTTLEGSDLTVTGSGTKFMVNETANIVCGNIKTANATLYFVDGVLLPS
ncbi:lipoprotein [Rhizocola hellebori]|uniref:Lipoprotein n=1 Tax=Rhizocola hellebori TaxID=1392758 RepID=A0A8J3VME1_9ACTN|nr:fasciclin domain-containing protein [Rhizocola hellebori]GIH11113.1 lipoprotein [Rhizocola hellebori]